MIQNKLQILIFKILFYILIVNVSFAQEVNWFIKPMITDVDNIYLHNNMQNLIKVKKDGKYGVVDFEGELIIPIDYERISISTLDYSIFCYNNNQLEAYDANGYKVNPKESNKQLKRLIDNQEPNKTNKIADDYSKKNPNFIITPRNKNRPGYTVLSSKGDTLVKHISESKIKYKLKFHNNNYLSYIFNSVKVYNTLGENIIDFGGDQSEIYNQGDYFIIKNKRKYTLFHFEKRVNDQPFDNLRFVEGYPYLIMKVDGKEFLVDYNLKKVSPTPANYIGHYKEADILYYILDKGALVWNLKTKTETRYDFTFLSKYNKTGDYFIVKQDTLYGVFNATSSKLDIPIKYKKVQSTSNQKFICSSPLQDKTKDDVYNNKGVLLWSAKNKMINVLLHDMCIMKENDTYSILDKEGKLIFQLQNGKNNITRQKNGDWVRIYDNKTIKYYQSKNLKQNIEEGIYYDNIYDKYKTPSKTNYYHVQKDKKHGLIDLNGDIIVPLIFDKIEASNSYNKYKIVKKDNKWGAIQLD